MKLAVMLAALVASAFALAGCGGDDSTEATTTETVATTPADTTTTTTLATTPTTTTTTTTTTTPTTQARVIRVKVVDGVPRGGIQRPTIEQGEKIVLVVDTDSGEAVHLHGYNIEKDVVSGTPVRIPFTANLPGRFEVELHPTDTLLAVLEVKP